MLGAAPAPPLWSAPRGARTRRALYNVDGEAISAVIDLLRTHRACDDRALKPLARTPKMRGILADADRRRARTEGGRSQPSGEGASHLATTATSSLPSSRYDRHRLYEEVWTEPTQKVAQWYGVSEVAIAQANGVIAAALNPTAPPAPSRDRR